MFNPFITRGQYTDTLLQLKTAALSIQIHDLTDDVLMYIRTSSFENTWFKSKNYQRGEQRHLSPLHNILDRVVVNILFIQ